MPIFSSTIRDIVSNRMPAPYYRFDGTGDYITLNKSPDEVLGNGTTKFSYGCWFRTLDQGGSNSGFLVGALDAVSGNYSFSVRVNAGPGNPSIVVQHGNGGGGWGPITNTEYYDGKWHHVFVVQDGATVYTYFDGNSIGSYAPSGGGNSDTAIDSDLDIGFGRHYSSVTGGVQKLNGDISNVKIYNTALTATEVKQLYSGASVPYKYKGANQTELIAATNDRTFAGASNWYNINMNAYDESGDLTLTASAVDQRVLLAAAYAPTTVGKRYRVSFDVANINGWWSLRNFANNNSMGNITGNGTGQSFEFTATDGGGLEIVALHDTSSADFDNFSIVQIGAVAEYDGSGMHRYKWYDKSGNDLHGTVSGATLENKHPYIITDGLQFHPDGLASSNSGVFDDYEEGTWSPVWNNLTIGNAVVTAIYTKIGRMVHLGLRMVWGSTTSASGDWSIANIPFPDFGNNYLPIHLNYIDSGSNVYRGRAHGVTATIYLRNDADTNFSATSPMTWVENDFIILQCTYEREI